MFDKIEDSIIRVLEGSKDYNDLKLFSEWYNASEDNKKSFLQLKDLYDRRSGGIYPTEFELQDTWERIKISVLNRSSKKSKNNSDLVSNSLFKKSSDETINSSSERASKDSVSNSSLKISKAVTVGSVAAIAILLITLGVRLFTNKEDIKWLEIETLPRSAPQTIYLSDGSTIILNASSYLKYPEKFTSDKREVYLDGEAYFSIASDKTKEFVVYTEKQAVRILGTEFNILGYSSDSTTVTTLVKGKIRLETLDNSNRVMQGITMFPNQQLYFDRQINQTSITTIDFIDAMDWIDGVYSFRDASLEAITKRIGKVTGITFIIPNEKIRQEAYTGKFFYNQTPEEIVKVLNFKGQYNFRTNNDTIYILN